MLFTAELAFVGRDEIRAPLKMPAWEATEARAIVVKSQGHYCKDRAIKARTEQRLTCTCRSSIIYHFWSQL